MNKWNIPRAEQISALEETLDSVKQKLELVAGCALWAFNGAIQGGKEYFLAAQAQRVEEEMGVCAAEAYANNQPMHDD